MSLDSLEILEQGGVIAFALPAHTSGTTQPLDVGLFQPFKQNVNRVIDDVAPVSGEISLDIYDLCRVLSRAYDDSFIPTIIRGSFEKAGIHPFNPMKYLGVPRPLSADSPETIVSVPELEEMLKKKQEERRNGLGIQKVVMKRGFVDTSAGLQLTSKEVLEKVSAKEAQQKKKWLEKNNKIRAQEAKFVQQKRAKRNTRAVFERVAMVYMAKMYGDDMELPRSLEVRRKLARERTVMKKASVVGCNGLTHEEKGFAPWADESVDQYEYPSP